MLKKRVIPCLDVCGGRVVKGVRFEDLRDAGDPVEAAQGYDEQGADELCFLDITASKEERGPLLDIVSRTAQRCFLPLTVGGGVGGEDDVEGLLRAGADKAAVNTALLEDVGIAGVLARRFGSQCVVAALDARWEGSGRDFPSGYGLYSHGGSRATGLDAVDFARRAQESGVGEILLTSMDRDGTKDGYDERLTRLVCEAVSVPVVASGGAGGACDMAEVLLRTGATAALAASGFHYGEFTVADVKAEMERLGVAARILLREEMIDGEV